MYFVYILTNVNNRVMYVGQTADLAKRLYEHRHRLVDGFTKRYNVHKLVYYEPAVDRSAALNREHEIKRWRREKKNALVEHANPEWKDLGEELGI